MSEEFWTMGGYGQYVWPAYGLALVALIWLLYQSIVSARRNEALLQQAREAR